jgi:hypothetical protein
MRVLGEVAGWVHQSKLLCLRIGQSLRLIVLHHRSLGRSCNGRFWCRSSSGHFRCRSSSLLGDRDGSRSSLTRLPGVHLIELLRHSLVHTVKGLEGTDKLRRERFQLAQRGKLLLSKKLKLFPELNTFACPNGCVFHGIEGIFVICKLLDDCGVRRFSSRSCRWGRGRRRR